jgi:hypothetical protein
MDRESGIVASSNQNDEDTEIPFIDKEKENGKRIMYLNTKYGITIHNVIGMDLILFNSLALLLFFDISLVYLL